MFAGQELCRMAGRADQLPVSVCAKAHVVCVRVHGWIGLYVCKLHTKAFTESYTHINTHVRAHTHLMLPCISTVTPCGLCSWCQVLLPTSTRMCKCPPSAKRSDARCQCPPGSKQQRCSTHMSGRVCVCV